MTSITTGSGSRLIGHRPQVTGPRPCGRHQGEGHKECGRNVGDQVQRPLGPGHSILIDIGSKLRDQKILLKADSTVALAVSKKLSSSTPTLNWVGAELGLVLEAFNMEELTIHHLAGKLNVAADHLSRPDKEGAPPGLEEIQIRVMNEAWMLDSRLPRQGCNRISGEKPQGFCQSLATFEAASVMLKQGELSRALRPLALLFDAVSHMNEPYAAAIFFQRSKMEVVPAEIAEDDSTLSWWQLIGCGLCFLCCYGVSAATCRCLGAMGTRFKTKWQGEAPKLKEKNREQLRGQLPMPPTHEGPGFSGGPGHAQKASPKRAYCWTWPEELSQ